MLEIVSPQNSRFKSYLELLESSGIKEQNRFLVFGKKLVLEVLKNHPSTIIEVLFPLPSPGKAHLTEDLPFELQSKVETRLAVGLGPSLFKEVDLFGTKFPILICTLPEIAIWNQTLTLSGFELLLPIGNPLNVGAILRSAVAFGVKKIVLLNECAHPFLPQSIRASSGAVFNLSFAKGPALKDLVENENLFSLDSEGTPLDKFQWRDDMRLLLGEEGQGIPSHLKSRAISIHQTSQMESLNVAIAAGIALHARFSKN